MTPDSADDICGPADVTVAPAGMDGRIFITDTGHDRVRVLSSSGQHLLTFGRTGSGASDLLSPRGVAVSASAIYVLDSGNGRIQQFDHAGNWVRSLTAPGGLLGATGITMDNVGQVFVAEAAADRIAKWDSAGNFVTRFGTSGTLLGSLRNPNDLCWIPSARVGSGSTWTTRDGVLAVADTGNRRIQGFKTDGTLEGQLASYTRTTSTDNITSYGSVFLAPNALGALSATGGQVLVTDRLAYRVAQYKADFWLPTSNLPVTAAAVTGGPWGGVRGAGVGQFDEPAGSAMAGDGTFYAADTGNDRIVRWKASAWLADWEAEGSATGELTRPNSAAASPSGSVAVVDVGNQRVNVYDAGGAMIDSFGRIGTGVEPMLEPSSVAYGLDADGRDAWFVSDVGRSAITVWSGMPTELSDYLWLTGLVAPRGMAFGHDGSLYVADSGLDQVVKVDPATGARLGAIGTTGTALGQFIDPWDVAVDSQGFLWVCDRGNDRIQKFNLDTGRPVIAYGGSGDSPGEFESPSGIEILPDSTVMIADTGNDRVQRMTLSGGIVQTFGGPGAYPSRMHGPVDVTLAGDQCWVVERDGDRIQVFLQDATFPVTTVSGVPSTPTSQSVTVSLSSTDTISGVKATYYRINTGAPQVYGAPLWFDTPGTHTVKWWAVDGVGNTESVYSATFVIDRTPPSGTMQAGLGSWRTTTTVEVKSAVTEASHMRVRCDGVWGPWMTYRASTNVEIPAEERMVSILAQYRDIAGNVLELGDSAGYDVTPPTTLVTGLPSQPTSQSITFTLTSKDTASGVGTVYYRLGSDLLPRLYTLPVVFSAQQSETIEWWAVDNLGNTEDRHEGAFTIDKTPPSGTMRVAEGRTWITTDVVVIDSSVTGADRMRVGHDGEWGPWTDYVGSTSVIIDRTEAIHPIRAQYLDAAGNLLQRSAPIGYDVTPPTTIVSGIPALPTNEDVTVELAPSDAHSGGSATYYRIGDGPSQRYVGPVVFTAAGTHTLEWWSVDAVGNEQEPEGATFIIDRTPASGAMIVGGGAMWQRTRQVRVDSAIVDAVNMQLGCDGVWGDWGPYASTSSVAMPDAEGIHTIQAAYLDIAANELRLEATIGYDATPPSTSVSGLSSRPTTENITLTFDSEDALSGVRDTYYALGSNAPVRYTDTVTFSEECSETLRWWSTDRAGNVEEGEAPIVIDRTPPSGALSVLHGGSWQASTLVELTSDVPDAVQMSLGYDEVWGPWIDYAAEASLTIPAEGRMVPVRVRYRDVAGNVLELADQVGCDMTGPNAPVIASSTHAPGILVRRKTTALFTWSEPHDINGVAGYSWIFDASPLTTPDTSIDGRSRSAMYSRLTGGTWYLHVRAVDPLGNWGPTSHYRIKMTSALSMGRPYARTASRRYRTVRISGLTGVDHDAAARGTVRVVAQRVDRRGYQWRDVPLQAAQGSGDAYSVVMRLPRGKWRFRVIHAYDGRFEPSTSAVSATVTVR